MGSVQEWRELQKRGRRRHPHFADIARPLTRVSDHSGGPRQFLSPSVRKLNLNSRS